MQKNLKKKVFKLLKTVIFITTALLITSCISYYFGFVKGEDKKIYSYTNLPNSCFVDSLIFASKISLALKAEGHHSPYSSIFGYMFKYQDDIFINGEKNTSTSGHAICIFEYKNKLWAYDVRYGTMHIGEALNKNMYELKVKDWVEKTYKVKISKSFLIDDWALPNNITEP